MKFAVKGLLRLFVLDAAERGASGGEIAAALSRLTDGKWRPSPGTLYPLLKKMQREGFLETRGKECAPRREKKYFLTKKGAAELEQCKQCVWAEMQAMSETIVPVVITVMHGYRAEDYDELKRSLAVISSAQSKLMQLPPAKRKERLKKFASSIRELSAC